MVGESLSLDIFVQLFANFSAGTRVYSRLERGPECVGLVTLIILGRELPCSKKYINSSCYISYLKTMLCVKWNSVAQGIFAANLCISENYSKHDLWEFFCCCFDLVFLDFSCLRMNADNIHEQTV